MPSDNPRGEGGAAPNPSTGCSLGDLAERSEVLRGLLVGRPTGDFGLDVWGKKEAGGCRPGLIGEVAIGEKKGSTTGFVAAV